jgi:hypothetical protein
MDGYFVWCGSLIRAEGRFHMFASRWPRDTGFPDGYRRHSEIVRAVSDVPEGPYEFREVVLAGRGGDWWDGRMCHNPKILRIGDRYVLFYNATDLSGRLLHGKHPYRQIGYADAPSIRGPWRRLDRPLPLGEDTNNPAPYVHDDGCVLLVYRDWALRMYIAKAPAYDGDYQVVARDFFEEGRLEDPDLYVVDGQYHMVMEDNQAKLTGHERHGGHLVSRDGIHWQRADDVHVYTHDIAFKDGTRFTAERRERPEMFNANAEVKGRGEPTHLATGVFHGGAAWNVVQRIAPE